jgi:hypothetical protein
MKGLKFIVASNNHCKHLQHIQKNVSENLQVNSLQTQKGHDQISLILTKFIDLKDYECAQR